MNTGPSSILIRANRDVATVRTFLACVPYPPLVPPGVYSHQNARMRSSRGNVPFRMSRVLRYVARPSVCRASFGMSRVLRYVARPSVCRASFGIGMSRFPRHPYVTLSSASVCRAFFGIGMSRFLRHPYVALPSASVCRGSPLAKCPGSPATYPRLARPLASPTFPTMYSI
jgi:hypothetical protein